MEIINLSSIKYPHLDRILNLKPNPEILLGKEIVWTEKRDGSNIGCYLDETGEIQFRSRNMDKTSEQFYGYLKETDQYPALIDLLKDALEWKDTYVIFGELLIKGRSPTKIETHDKHEFILFDIWSNKTGGFLNYTAIYQHAYHFNIPVVELYGTCNVNTIEHLLEFRDKMLQVSLDNNREGTVGKYWNGSEYIYFKEKNDTPKYEKVPRAEDDGKPILPTLPDSEVTGALAKVHSDLGEGIFDIKKAMPMFAQYVGEEIKKHNCSAPEKKLFVYYNERIKELKTK